MEYLIGLFLSLAVAEIAVASGFLLLATIGYKRSLWLVAIALVGHGVFDIVHDLVTHGNGRR